MNRAEYRDKHVPRVDILDFFPKKRMTAEERKIRESDAYKALEHASERDISMNNSDQSIPFRICGETPAYASELERRMQETDKHIPVDWDEL